MIDRVFIDTNMLVYLSVTNDSKAQTINQLVYDLENAVISTQVLGEFSNVAYRNKVLSSIKLAEYIEIFSNSFEVFQISASTILKAIQIKDKYLFSFWDSMIIASALESSCTILYSEDMQHNQVIENQLTIKNPFKF